MPEQDSTGKVLPVFRDLEQMDVEELIEENMRLGQLEEYSRHDIKALRIEINRVRDLKLAEMHRELRRKEEAGEFPPGQVIKLGDYQAEVHPLQ